MNNVVTDADAAVQGTFDAIKLRGFSRRGAR
jgi:hypothetical protein